MIEGKKEIQFDEFHLGSLPEEGGILVLFESLENNILRDKVRKKHVMTSCIPALYWKRQREPWVRVRSEVVRGGYETVS